MNLTAFQLHCINDGFVRVFEDFIVPQQDAEPDEETPWPAAPTVWIVDDDLGFVWWLGEIFTEARCRALPAFSCEDALSLMKRLNIGADLIVVNPQLPGVSAMLQTLNRANHSLKIVTIQKSSEPHVIDERSQATLERPSGFDPVSRTEWLKKVRRLLRQIESAASSRKGLK